MIGTNGTSLTSTGCSVFKNQPDYDLCQTIEVVLWLSLGTVALGVFGDTFSEKVMLNVIVFGVFAASAASVGGVWLAFNQVFTG